MPVLKLTPQFILTSLLCPPNKSRVEYCDTDVPGLYIAVRDSGPGQGVYYLRWKDPNNKTCHTKLGRTIDIDLAEARKAARQLRAEIALGANPQADAKARKEVLKFGDFMELHYLPHARKTKRSYADDERMNRLRLVGAFANKRLNEITRYEIIKFHTGLKDEGLAPASCDHYVKLLKHSLNCAIDWGLLNDKNPAARIPLYNADNQVENLLSEEELQRLLVVLRTDANRPICLIILFLLSTGARLNEALQAKWSQIDISARVWLVPAFVSKSRKSRAIPLTDSGIDVLQQLNTKGQYDHLFVNQRTGKPYVSIRKQWLRIQKVAKLSKHMRIHDTRHTMAQLMCSAGRSLLEVQAVLGHQHYSTTSRYARLSMASVQAAANVTSLKIGVTSPVVPPSNDEIEVDRQDTPEAANTASVIIQGAGSKAA
jgi:integrase